MLQHGTQDGNFYLELYRVGVEGVGWRSGGGGVEEWRGWGEGVEGVGWRNEGVG